MASHFLDNVFFCSTTSRGYKIYRFFCGKFCTLGQNALDIAPSDKLGSGQRPLVMTSCAMLLIGFWINCWCPKLRIIGIVGRIMTDRAIWLRFALAFGNDRMALCRIFISQLEKCGLLYYALMLHLEINIVLKLYTVL